MLLWIGFAVLTAAAIAAVAHPLLRAEGLDEGADEGDLAVYRDQLAEIEADRGRGLIGAAEAEAARAEVARRLIQRAGERHRTEPSRGASGLTSQRVVWALAAIVPATSIALYLAVGSPGRPARPHAERVSDPAAQASVMDLVAQVESRLRERPEDGHGWDVIGPVYLRLQRYADAADAFERAMRLLGETPKRLAGFAEAAVLASDGIVNEAARRAYEKVLAADPERHDARFWLAVAKEQDGATEAAIAAYTELLARAPPEAAWRTAITERITDLKKRVSSGGTAPATGPGNPAGAAVDGNSRAALGVPRSSSEEPAATSAETTPGARIALVTRMVDDLAARLKSDGRDLAGWLRLVRAYNVLGRKSEAAAALAEARRNFATDPASLAEIEALAKTLGLDS